MIFTFVNIKKKKSPKNIDKRTQNNKDLHPKTASHDCAIDENGNKHQCVATISQKV